MPKKPTATMKTKLPKIRKVAQITHPRSWVFYGRSGTGKTTLACTFPPPILLLDVNDQGTDSVSDVEGLDVAEINSWEDFDQIYWFLRKDTNYETVVIDTTSQLQRLCERHILEKKNKKTDNIGDWGSMTQREYGDVAALLKEKIINFRDLGMEVVFIAQDRVNNAEDHGDEGQLAPEVGPALYPSVQRHLNASVNMIGNTFIRMRDRKLKGRRTKQEEVYCLRVGPNPVYITKTRKPRSIKVPSYIEDPTYKDILEVLKGE